MGKRLVTVEYPKSNIQDYIINIEGSSLKDRLRLRQVLIDNDQSLLTPLRSKNPTLILRNEGVLIFYISEWLVDIDIKANISLENFIQKFKKK